MSGAMLCEAVALSLADGRSIGSDPLRSVNPGVVVPNRALGWSAGNVYCVT